MTLSDDIKSALEADTALMALLTGGIHNDVEEISRQNTPGAFDANKEIKPCALIKFGTESKITSLRRGVQTPFTVYFYERQGYDAIDAAMSLVFDDLNEAKIGTNVWNIRFDIAVYQQRDQALDCALESLRFIAVRMR
jgi:hypothetical protein